MGFTGEIVRTVFAKSRHDHGTHAKMSNAVGKKRWRSSVRSYLCGDSILAYDDDASVATSTVAEVGFGSASIGIDNWPGGEDVMTVCAEKDTASQRSSEATVNQPLDENLKEKQNSTYKLLQQEDAALIIQSAFRAFRAKRARDDEDVSRSKKSIGTSIEVQTGNSSDIFSIKEESFDLRDTMQHRSKAQVLKIQEEWDDSTVSSVISKMRIQNKMEAATRRERALAYAFSQQLRICSKRKQSMTKGEETNMGWSWLERWMAARQPEMNLPNNNNIVCKKMTDGSMGEKESCGSNEVSSLFEVGISSSYVQKNNVLRPAKIRSKGMRSLSRQTSASSRLCPKDVKKVHRLEDDKEKRKRPR